MTWIRVALFTDFPPADLLRQQLLHAGIRAEVHREPAVARLWFVSRRNGAVRLDVPAASAELTARLLKEWDHSSSLLRRAVRCPDCASFRVDFPQFTNKSLLTNLALGFLSGIGLVEQDFYCERCHRMWRKPALGLARPRGHMSPNYFLTDID